MTVTALMDKFSQSLNKMSQLNDRIIVYESHKKLSSTMFL